MTAFSTFPGFDGLMTLSRREGVDIRPTLLRVLTDLYVQTPSHTSDEERQFVELTSRLFDEVDDATRAAVRARLSIYPNTPAVLLRKVLGRASRGAIEPIAQVHADPVRAEAQYDSEPAPPRPAETLSMQPGDASELSAMFFAADARERMLILRSLETTPLKAAARIDPRRAEAAVAALVHMAMEADLIGFTAELAHILILPMSVAQEIVNDPGGEALACAARAIGMPSDAFQRVLLFLDPELGASVQRVYMLARLYDAISERVALIMLAAWRGATQTPARGRHRPALHDEERQRARQTPAQGRSVVPGSAAPNFGTNTRNGSTS